MLGYLYRGYTSGCGARGIASQRVFTVRYLTAPETATLRAAERILSGLHAKYEESPYTADRVVEQHMLWTGANAIEAVLKIAPNSPKKPSVELQEPWCWEWHDALGAWMAVNRLSRAAVWIRHDILWQDSEHNPPVNVVRSVMRQARVI